MNPFDNNKKSSTSITPSSNAISGGGGGGSGEGGMMSGSAGTAFHIVAEIVVIGGVYYMLNSKINSLEERVVKLEKNGVESSKKSNEDEDENSDNNSGNNTKRINNLEQAVREIGEFLEGVEKELDNLHTENEMLKKELANMKRAKPTQQITPQAPPQPSSMQPIGSMDVSAGGGGGGSMGMGMGMGGSGGGGGGGMKEEYSSPTIKPLSAGQVDANDKKRGTHIAAAEQSADLTEGEKKVLMKMQKKNLMAGGQKKS
jgi:hypothetical protein